MEFPDLEFEERLQIEATHSWVYRCFPPQPTVCMYCGARQSDANLNRCGTAALEWKPPLAISDEPVRTPMDVKNALRNMRLIGRSGG